MTSVYKSTICNSSANCNHLLLTSQNDRQTLALGVISNISRVIFTSNECFLYMGTAKTQLRKTYPLILLHSERTKLCKVLAVLSSIGLKDRLPKNINQSNTAPECQTFRNDLHCFFLRLRFLLHRIVLKLLY